jgi:hypothetical protein
MRDWNGSVHDQVLAYADHNLFGSNMKQKIRYMFMSCHLLRASMGKFRYSEIEKSEFYLMK